MTEIRVRKLRVIKRCSHCTAIQVATPNGERYWLSYGVSAKASVTHRACFSDKDIHTLTDDEWLKIIEAHRATRQFMAWYKELVERTLLEIGSGERFRAREFHNMLVERVHKALNEDENLRAMLNKSDLNWAPWDFLDRTSKRLARRCDSFKEGRKVYFKVLE